MTGKTFQACVAFTLSWEGGYSNDPDDPGRETKFGISKTYHPDVDIKGLTRADAEKIYFEKYWIPSGANSLPWPYCLAVFDAAVIPGIGACRMFVRAAEAQKGKSPFTRALILCNAREAYFRDRAAKNPTKMKWLKGWINRVNALRKACAKPAP